MQQFETQTSAPYWENITFFIGINCLFQKEIGVLAKSVISEIDIAAREENAINAIEKMFKSLLISVIWDRNNLSSSSFNEFYVRSSNIRIFGRWILSIVRRLSVDSDDGFQVLRNRNFFAFLKISVAADDHTENQSKY